MQINPKLIKKQFEKSFETYNKNAIVQKIMAQKLVSELSTIKAEFGNILELGCGTGLLTQELTKKINFNTYMANDLIEKSQLYVNKFIPDVLFYCGDARRIKPSKKADLIISNALFQWFENLEKITANYKNILNKDGILAFSTFSSENFKEILALTGLTLNYKPVNEIQKIIEKNYKILYIESFLHTLSFETPLHLLAHMKQTGVNSLITYHWSFKEVKNFCDEYKDKFPDITLTYAPVIVICQKI